MKDSTTKIPNKFLDWVNNSRPTKQTEQSLVDFC